MKKHLIALAVVGAFAVPATAQNVTLYGTIDTGAAHIVGAGTATSRANGLMFMDGSVASSVWGIRGTEDLGGGLRAVFEAQSDLITNSGGSSQAGLWRRAAYAGIQGSLGEVTFGIRTNPLIATNGALMPLGGNSTQTSLASSLSYADFFTKNAITLTSANYNGLVAQFQWGMANSFNNSAPGGNVEAGSLAYTNGGLTLRGAYHNRTSNGTTSGANIAGPTTIAADPTSATAARAAIVGATYTVGAWAIGAALVENNEQGGALLTQGGTKVKRSGTQIGLAYQMSPALRVGGSFARAEGSELANVQARYTLSKRTSAYAQFGQSTNNNNTISSKQVNFAPLAANTITHPAGIANSFTALAGSKQQGYGVGIIHTF